MTREPGFIDEKELMADNTAGKTIYETGEKKVRDEKLERMKERALENLDKRGGLIEIKFDKKGKRVIVFNGDIFENDNQKIVSVIDGKKKIRSLSDEIKSTCDPIYSSEEYGNHSTDRVLRQGL